MSSSKDYFDIKSEPVGFAGQFKGDPAEQKVPAIDGAEDEVSTIRDSVANEPVFSGQFQRTEFGQWLTKKHSECTLFGSMGITLLAALIAGPFAIIGAFMSGSQGMTQALYAILFGPVIEELLKQSGMIYLLEKKPYRIFTPAQFVVAALISALFFSVVENLMYVHLYVPESSLENHAAFAMFRWKWCTLLHVSCSVVASFGLIRVWKKQMTLAHPADLANGFWWFFASIFIHGAYNLWATFWGPEFL